MLAMCFFNTVMHLVLLIKQNYQNKGIGTTLLKKLNKNIQQKYC